LDGVSPALTVIIPTRNRPHQVIAQLRLFRALDFPYPVVIADSSDAVDDALARAVEGTATYRHFAPGRGYYEKLADVLPDVTTPFVLTVPDKKVTFPHAIAPLIDRLRHHHGDVAAVGYVLRFQRIEQDFDIFRVFFFTPSIDEEEPLRRLYHLMRRYQVSGFAVFRTQALARCVAQAIAVKGQIFQEIMFMSTLVLHGGIARLPVIFSLHGAEESLTPVDQRHPLRWFVRDSPSFFHHYAVYRDALAVLIRENAVPVPDRVDLAHLLDLIHATWLARESDTGVINHVTRMLLGDPLPAVEAPRDWPGPRPVGDGDLVHTARAGTRRYLWRRAVLQAEPRAEITITAAEIQAVERGLEVFYAD
jgi:glycosyltransferase domain-containing protein